jgi:RNase P subunit RPR2
MAMSRDALTPLTYPHDVVRVACAKCGREGRYPRERIIARYGKNAAMPDVLRGIAD